MSMSLDLVSIQSGPTGSLTGVNTLTLATPLPKGKWEFVDAKFGSTVAVTADPTNNATFALKKGSTTLASKVTTAGGTGNLVANQLVLLTAAAALGTAAVFDGDTEIPLFDVAKGGTGVTVNGQFSATFRKVAN